MECCCVTCCGGLIVLFIIYKVLDRFIRGLRIGDYGSRYVLVTGSDSGFGNWCVKRLDRLGCHVFAACMTEKGEDDIRKECSNQVYPIRLDVTKPEEIRKAVEFVKSKLPKGSGLWGLVNNAGVPGRVGMIDWMRLDDYKDALNVNTLGIVDVTMNFLPLIKKAKGRVVITTSQNGFFGLPDMYPYNVSKFGAEAFGDGLRRSLRMYGCKVSLVEPGVHATPMAAPESARRAITNSWNNTAPEIRAEYGDDYVDKAAEHLLQIQKFKSSRVSDVIDAYEDALMSRYPRARYLVGLDANFIFKPLHLMPECISDWILEDILWKGFPKPASLGRG